MHFQVEQSPPLQFSNVTSTTKAGSNQKPVTPQETAYVLQKKPVHSGRSATSLLKPYSAKMVDKIKYKNTPMPVPYAPMPEAISNYYCESCEFTGSDRRELTKHRKQVSNSIDLYDLGCGFPVSFEFPPLPRKPSSVCLATEFA